MYNKAILIGHMGSDPDTRMMDNGTKVANFSLATTERYKDKSGERQKRVTWHKITAFGSVAEIIEKYLKKGSLAQIEGRFSNRSYTNKKGVEVRETEIITESVVMLGGKKENGQRQEEESSDLPW